jgi:hypothetical protein
VTVDCGASRTARSSHAHGSPWLLVDFLTQDRVGVIGTRTKPRIKLSRVLGWLDKELDILL